MTFTRLILEVLTGQIITRIHLLTRNSNDKKLFRNCSFWFDHVEGMSHERVVKVVYEIEVDGE